MLAVDLLRTNVVERAAQGKTTLFVEDPSVSLVDLIRIQSDQVLYSWESRVLWLWNSSETEEHGPEPNLFDMSLMRILRDDLLDSELSSAFDVFALPN